MPKSYVVLAVTPYFGLKMYVEATVSARLSTGSMYREPTKKLVRSVRFKKAPRVKTRAPSLNGSTQPVLVNAVRSPTFQMASYSRKPTFEPKLSRCGCGKSDADKSSVK